MTPPAFSGSSILSGESDRRFSLSDSCTSESDFPLLDSGSGSEEFRAKFLVLSALLGDPGTGKGVPIALLFFAKVSVDL